MIRIEETKDLDACMKIRTKVFVEEQNVPVELEHDDADATATHLLATLDDRPVGTLRILIDGDHAKIGRVAVLAEQRGTGLGHALMQAALGTLRQRGGIREVGLGSQTHALGFYERMGFEAYGPEFDDAGIPHRAMKLIL